MIYAHALSIESYKGWRQIGHGGGDAGFRVYACRFPEKNLGIVVFSNSGTVNPINFVHKIADVLITESKQEPKLEEKKAINDTIFLKKLQGQYYSERGEAVEIVWRNKQLIAREPDGGTQQVNLGLVGNNRYSVNGGKVLVLDEKNQLLDSVQNFTMENYGNTTYFKRQPAVLQKITDELAGKYYCQETEAFYYITEKNGQLTLAHRKYGKKKCIKCMKGYN